MVNHARFEPASPGLLHQTVIISIFRALLQGKIKPGEHLTEEEIANELRVSRSPVRRALQEMERQGILVLLPRRGARVVSWSVNDIEDFWHLRNLLESFAAEQAALRSDSQETNALENKLKTYLSAVEKGEREEINRSDVEFHRWIVQMSRNFSLITAYESMVLRIHMFLILEKNIYPPESRYRRPVDPHQEIFKAIKEGDGKLAHQLMEDHISNNGRSLVERMRKKGGPEETETVRPSIEHLFSYLKSDNLPEV